ncbi:MAG TPA: hypothetical protein VGU46_03970 [Acidobacteriaceae bacterium]|nr:hypothetical protein [Acidobacteriaceae bacterium]
MKIYLEVPASVSLSQALRRLNAPSAIEIPPFHRGSRLVMIGQDLRMDGREFYFRLPALDRMEALAVRSSLESNQETAPLIAVLVSLLSMPVETALQWLNLGYSVGFSAEGARRISLFFNAAAVDGVRLRALLRKPASLYAEFIPADGGNVPHGMVALIGRQGEVETRVGISALALANQGKAS